MVNLCCLRISEQCHLSLVWLNPRTTNPRALHNIYEFVYLHSVLPCLVVWAGRDCLCHTKRHRRDPFRVAVWICQLGSADQKYCVYSIYVRCSRCLVYLDTKSRSLLVYMARTGAVPSTTNATASGTAPVSIAATISETRNAQICQTQKCTKQVASCWE